MPQCRGFDEARLQAPGSAAVVWAGRPLMRTLRIRRNRRTRARSPTTEVASTDARRKIFPVSCRHSRTPMIRHGRPAKDETDLSLRGADEARQATALARPQTRRAADVGPVWLFMGMLGLLRDFRRPSSGGTHCCYPPLKPPLAPTHQFRRSKKLLPRHHFRAFCGHWLSQKSPLEGGNGLHRERGCSRAGKARIFALVWE